MLRMTSKTVKEVVDKMRLPAVVRLSWSFWEPEDMEHLSRSMEEAQRDLQHARRAVQETEAKTNAIAGELKSLRAHHSDDARNGTAAEKLQFVLTQAAHSVDSRISTLELPRCEMKGQERCKEACRSAGAVPRAGAP
jgi:hypothetical protein